MLAGATIRLPQGHGWRTLYKGILVAYCKARSGGQSFEAALAAAVDAANSPSFIPAMLAGDVLRQLPYPYSDEPVYMRPSPADIARGVWRYWDEHPYGSGHTPLFDMGILVEAHWAEK
nr:MAG TPA: hypothetical protein [Caudoviricetes sp.]